MPWWEMLWLLCIPSFALFFPVLSSQLIFAVLMFLTFLILLCRMNTYQWLCFLHPWNKGIHYFLNDIAFPPTWALTILRLILHHMKFWPVSQTQGCWKWTGCWKSIFSPFFEVSKACTYSAKKPLSNWWKQPNAVLSVITGRPYRMTSVILHSKLKLQSTEMGGKAYQMYNHHRWLTSFFSEMHFLFLYYSSRGWTRILLDLCGWLSHLPKYIFGYVLIFTIARPKPP